MDDDDVHVELADLQYYERAVTHGTAGADSDDDGSVDGRAPVSSAGPSTPVRSSSQPGHVTSPILAHPTTPSRRGGGAPQQPGSPMSPGGGMDMSHVVPTSALEIAVDRFLRALQEAIARGDTHECALLYEHEFQLLTEKHFASTEWPHPDCPLVRSIARDDAIFEMCYQILYYRHLYAKLGNQLTLADREASWRTYIDLFVEISDADHLEFDLPNQLLWDIVDEFIYQFQEFCNYRARVKSLSIEDLEYLRDEQELGEVWNCASVLHWLEKLRDKSGVLALLERERRDRVPVESELWESSPHHVIRMLGYYSIIGLMRCHVMLGDYHSALRALDPLDMSNKKALYARLHGCNITTHYYLGFAYLSLHRYVDAQKRFTDVLTYWNRLRKFNTRSYQWANLLKKQDQLCGLLAISLALHPARVADEYVNGYIREQYGDKLPRMQKGDLGVYESVYSFSAPKFVSPVPPDYDEEPRANHHLEPLQHQFKIFAEEIPLQAQLQELRSYLKLYTSIPVSKIASFLSVSVDEFRTQILRLKRKTRQLVWQSGPAISGEWQTHSDVDFYLDGDMIYIADVKSARRQGEFFVRHIVRFEQFLAHMASKDQQ